jgi:hypothetical protein
MSARPTVLAVGLVDERGVVGTGGVRAEWADLGVEPPGTGRSFRALFGRPDATFRRIDRASRALVLAAEAAGLADVLPRQARDATALVVETERGCLDADLRFQHGRQEGVLEGAVFPYTLPSASLGEVALRHGLRGPALCLSIGPDGRGEALREAVRLIEDGEAPYALAGRVEALAGARPGLAPAVHALDVLLAAPHLSPRVARDAAPDGASGVGPPGFGALDDGPGEPFERLANALPR